MLQFLKRSPKCTKELKNWIFFFKPSLGASEYFQNCFGFSEGEWGTRWQGWDDQIISIITIVSHLWMLIAFRSNACGLPT